MVCKVVSRTYKKCSKCGTEKHVSEFGRDSKARDGLFCWCRVCSRASVKAWSQANPERRASLKRASYERCREKRNAYGRAWYDAQPPEKHRTRWLAWVAANPDRFKATQHRHLARKRNAMGELTADVVRDVRETSDGMCAYCLRTDRPLALEHVIPLCRGGANEPDNLVMACRPCNSRKGGRGPLAMVRYL